MKKGDVVLCSKYPGMEFYWVSYVEFILGGNQPNFVHFFESLIINKANDDFNFCLSTEKSIKVRTLDLEIVMQNARKFKEGDLVTWNGSPDVLYRFSHYEFSDINCSDVFIVADVFGSPFKTKEDRIKKVGLDENMVSGGRFLGAGADKANKEFKKGEIVHWGNEYCQQSFYGYEVIGHELDKIIIQCRVTHCEYRADACDLYLVDDHHQSVLQEQYFSNIELSKKPESSSQVNERTYVHYFKDVRNLQEIDVYRVITLFNVTNPCLAHAIKKLLVAGGRGGGKDIQKDVKEAMDSLARFIEMQQEDGRLKS